MRRFIISIALFLVGFSCLAQLSDDSALIRFVEAQGPCRVSFSMSGKGIDGQEHSSETGTMDLAMPSFRVSLGRHLIVGDAETLWYYDTEDQEVMVMNSFIFILLQDSKLDRSGDVPVVTYTQSNGSKMVFRILSIEPLPEDLPSDHFVFNTAALPEDAVVTDIR